MKFSLIIPTLNRAASLAALLDCALTQSSPPSEIIVLDSSSSDDTAAVAALRGANVVTVSRAKFDHGGTRSVGGRMAQGEILLYMTDDALPASPDCFEQLLKPFADPAVAAVTGRQLPAPGATPVARHLRAFNYPEQSYRRTWDDRRQWGLKAAFLSNSFCAYRKSALERAGWFPANIIIAEDMRVGLELLRRGGTLCYSAQACVYHSYNLPLKKEFSRYFDIGVMHRAEKDIIAELGRAEGEGKKYVLSALNYLPVWRYPGFFLRCAAKYTGYLLGKNYSRLPRSVVRRFTLNPSWWKGR